MLQVIDDWFSGSGLEFGSGFELGSGLDSEVELLVSQGKLKPWAEKSFPPIMFQTCRTLNTYSRAVAFTMLVLIKQDVDRKIYIFPVV